MFVHVVFFWLPESASQAEKDELKRDALESLKQIPVVKNIWTGVPAMTPREVVDNSYTVALCVVLDDAKAHDAYQVHPIHLEFAGRWKTKWAKIRVYDFH